MRKYSVERLVPSWTGFQILSNNVLTLKHRLVTWTRSILQQQILQQYFKLCRALKIKESLKLPEIVCVFDQATFAKAAEIVWKSPDRFQDVIIMLGTFHLITMYMSILSKRFKDGGLFDVLVQSSILAESSC